MQASSERIRNLNLPNHHDTYHKQLFFFPVH